MIFMFDTDTCIAAIRKPDILFPRLNAYIPGDVVISSVTLAELAYGCQKSKRDGEFAKLRKLLAWIPAVDFNVQAAFQYGRVRAELERNGMVIGAYDMMIAAHALSLGLIVVTGNEKHFLRVRGLKTENWIQS